jgi:hypothetical protein
MPSFTYLGDHAKVTLWGIDFLQGVAVDVSGANEPIEHVVRKLRGNSHFSETFDGVEVLMPEDKPKRKYTRRGQ